MAYEMIIKGLSDRIRGTAQEVAIPDIHKSIIAAVNGAAIGYWMDISLQCDIRIAKERPLPRRPSNGLSTKPFTIPMR